MLIEKFEEAVEAFPERIAIKMEAETFTYKQLYQYANQVAARIIASTGLSNKGKQAALLFEHGADMIIALIAALKANMVYVPLDRTYPENRLTYMLEDSEATLILTNTNNLHLAQGLARKITGKIEIMDTRETRADQFEWNVTRTVPGEAPAYILYTSGSTGRPKGVIQNHDNVLYYTRNWVQRFSITPSDRMTLLTAFSHDGFVQDLWSALLSGATLYPYDVKNAFDRTRLPEFIKNEKITIWHSVPTLFRYFTDSLTPGEIFPYLRFILLGGEPLRKHDIEIFKRHFPNALLANVYGQTESSVSSIAVYTREDVFGLPILGKPLDKTAILLVTEEGEILEDLGTGEIVIACDHIASGYWRDEKNTREKFTHDPDLGKLYWTGDLGRLKGNREIAIMGRKDLQIKIRGFRVEVGEIETVLLQHKAVKEAAVIMKETRENEPYLCCYFTSKEPVDAARLREYLLHRVPDYMIPRTFIQMEHLPLTPSGKIDRNALPEPGTKEMEKKYKPPVTATEKQLAGIWQEVLNLKPGHRPIGLDDNFFELGGHSLRAIKLIARTHKTFQVKLELEEVFSFPVLRELVHLIDGKSRESFKAIHPVEKKEYYPLSSTQKRLYFLRQMEPEGTGYNLSDIIEFEEEIDIKKVEKIFQKLIQRHESLRTSFHMIDSQSMQKVHAQGSIDFAIDYYDLTRTQVEVKVEVEEGTGEGRVEGWKGRREEEKEAPFGQISDAFGGQYPKGQMLRAKSFISSFVRPFDLARAPLFRIGVIRIDKNKNILMIDMHHIISDGTSQEIFSEDFTRLYEGKGLVSLKLQYKDYAQWQRGEIDRGELKQQEIYWLKEFSGDIPVLELPFDYPRPLIQGFEGDNIRFAMEKEISQGLKRLAQQEDVTLYMVLLAAVNVLLFKLSNQEDIVVGTPVVGRRHADLEGIIGMFVNTLTLRNYPQGEKTFAGFLKEIREKTMKAFENQEYPFEELVDRAAINRDMSRNPLFDVMFALHNQSTLPPEMMKLMEKGRYANIPFRHNSSKFDLTLHAIEAGEMLGVSIEYSTKLFKKETIQRFIRYLQIIVSSVSDDPSRKLSDIDILSKEEIEQLLIEFNRTNTQYPRHQTIHQLFKEQVEKTPDHIAVVGTHHLHESAPLEGTRGLAPLNALVTITYRELNQRSNRLAYLLGKKGVGPDTVVAIMMERSLEMIMGILGILKAGGAYMPIDPDYPKDRVEYMLADSSVRVLVATPELQVKAEVENNFKQPLELPLQFVNIETGLATAFELSSSTLALTSTSRQAASAACLAYIIYTSGSTGKPKGVMMEHQSLVNLIKYHHHCTNLDYSRVTQFASISFDVSFQEIFFTLAAGGTLVVLDKHTKTDIPQLCRIIRENRIKTVFLPISFIKAIFSDEDYAEQFPGTISHIVSAGEQMVVINRFRTYLQENNIYLHNHYGPSETHVVTSKTLDPKREIPELPSIGTPISNTRIYILDNALHLQPIGVVGELYIGGTAPGRGYLNKPELTNSKFQIPNSKEGTNAPIPHSLHSPHSPYLPYSTLYQTGDRGRWLPDGNIEFLGRIDQQVKIRGYRIEPGEIEKQILTYEQQKIKAAVVIPREDRDKDRYLCGYLVTEHRIDISALKEYLTRILPDYMIPPFFVRLEEIPLTTSGKVDKSALPEPEKVKREYGFTGPGNEVEQELAALWSTVLGIEANKIGTRDNFFQLGGHSLKATQLTARIHKTFNIKVPLPELFKTPTINGISQYLQRAAETQFAAIEKAEPREYYPLSSAQKRLFVLQQMEEESTVYNMPLVIPMTGEIDKEKLEQTFQKLIARHESLRTSFHMVANQPVQKIHDEVEFKIEYYQVEVKVKVEEERPSLLEGTRGLAPLSLEPVTALISSFIRPFDLSQAPLLRVGLIHTPPCGHPSQEGSPRERYILMVDMHHIISDGVSLEILSHEFTALYNGQQLPELPIRYKDYAVWQNRRKIRESTLKQEAYWLKVLRDEIPVLRLPYDFPRPGIQDFAGGKMDFEIGKQETPGLKQLTLAQGATLYMVLLAAYALLMSKLSGQEDISIGTPTAGRQHPDLENIIGMFVNTLVMRSQPLGEKTFQAFLNEVKINTLEAFENQEYQFEELVEKAAIKRDASRNPLFDVMFSLRHMNMPIQEALSPGHKPIHQQFEGRVSKFDLSLDCTDAGETIYGIVEYAARLFKPETIRRFIAYFKRIISAILADPNIPIAEIEILTEEEKNRILYVFNDTPVDFPEDKILHRLFKEQVEKTPDYIAAAGTHHIYESTPLEGTRGLAPLNAPGIITYRELNQRSNQLAHLLRKKGVEPDTIVGIMVDRSIEMIIGILGILTAGGAYLPIDPGYPEERIKYMLKDSGTKILVTANGLSEKLEKLSIVNCQLLIVNDSPPNRRRLNNPPKEANNNLQLDRTNLAYILYTSGTTGQPKGVMVEHRNAAAYLNAFNREFYLTGTDIVVQQASFTFDVFFEEVFPVFLKGGKIVIPSRDQARDVNLMEEFIIKHSVTIISCTPLMLNLLNQGNKLDSVRIFISGGDVLKGEYIGNLLKWAKVYNTYGPTETTVCATYYRCPDDIESNVPLGKPIVNYNVYILDNHHLVPIGVPGEICISGAGVARGYLNNPGLTAEKFNHDLWDFQDYQDKRKKIQKRKKIPGSNSNNYRSYRAYLSYIYKTGDRGRWLPDGNIEFLGRIDSQIKIRGFRIEPGEIENQLLDYEDITAAVIIPREDEVGDKHLCAYIVSDKEISIPMLKKYLSHSLPYYMIPSYVIQVEKLPLTTHGKVNRQALPKPLPGKPTAFIPPRDWWEEQMALLWAEVLGLSKEMLSIDTNFFEIGGQSLKATVLSAKIHKALEVKVPLAAVFKTPTIRGLADYIKKTAPNQGYTAIEPSEKKDYYALSPTQEGIYIVQRLDPSSTAYHIPFFLEISGTADKERFEQASRALIQRHDSLRTSFDIVNGEPVQKIHHKLKFEIEYYDLTTGDEHKKKYKLQNTNKKETEGHHSSFIIHHSFVRPFDLAFPPLFRVGMIRSQEKKHILMVDIHHIISDGTSINILVRDFLALYQGLELQPHAIQYKDYSQWRNSRQHREIMAKQEMVWLKELGGELPLLNLPVDFPRPPVQEFAGKSLAFKFSTQETQEVKNFVLKENVTTYMMVLSVFTVLMAKLSGQDDIIVGTPAVGRNHENLQSIVGMFVNTLALRNFPIYYNTFKEFLHSVKEKTLTAFENQDFAFEELVDRLSSKIPRDKGRNPIFDVMVAPQDIETTAFKLPGLTLEPYRNTGNNHRTAKFDLTLIDLETPEELFFTLLYRTRLFKEETIRRFINYFKKIFAAVVENPQKRIGEIEIITEKERQQILEEFNDTRAEYPADKTLHRLFAEQAARTPDHTALVGIHQTHKKHEKKYNMSYLSYKELNKKSNQLAHLLQEKGVQPDTIVSIMMERSIDMIIGLMGILKAGAAYLPIDPEYPQERIDYMLKDSGVQVMVVDDTSYVSWLSFVPKALLNLSEGHHLNSPASQLPSFPASLFSNLAYIIYTSGSTGKPKGVIIEHRNAVNVVTWYAKHYHLDCHTRVLQLSSYTFDASVNQVFGTLNHGSGLYLVSKELLNNLEKLRMYIEAHDITIVHYVPLFLRELLLEHPRVKSIKIVISGGDLLEKTIKDKFLEKGYTLYNQYGPTETTVNVFAGQCGEGKVTLGRPISNTICLILDNANHLCPVGITGELCIAGVGVSRGYLNQPERTAEKFDHDLWDLLDYQDGDHSSYRSYKSYIYRTGDLARWFSDGRVEFLGRLDHQIKIRGFRVELGEIESHLHRINGVKNAVVIAREGQTNEKYLYLCAYIAAEEAISVSYLKDELAKRLPTYMIPDFFVLLEEIPMTPIGKLNRKALPEPAFQLKKNKFPVPPRNHIEKKLADIWLKVLLGKIAHGEARETREALGIDDNFFEWGGNSIKAIRLISEIYKTFNVEVPMGLIFKTPFIRSISAHLMQHTFTVTGEEIVVSLSPDKNDVEKIFCFPPAVGYGIAYMQLAPLFNAHSLYAFNYIDSDDKNKDKMERYVDTIQEIQPGGPYRLLGYSAGGRLCIKAAELLEKRGNQVRDIILLDCYSQRESLPVDIAQERSREFDRQLKQGLKELGLEPLTDKVMDIMEKYAQYHDTLKELEPPVLFANIHLIKAEDKQDQEGFIGWKAFTRGEYHEYEGFGIHKEMLSAGFIEQNAAVIDHILKPVPHDAKPISKKLWHHTFSVWHEKFLEFVGLHPGAMMASNYRDMSEKLGSDELQPWPTFIDQPAREIMEKTALTTINLIRSIPKQIFNYDPHLMSRYYQLPVNMIETQLDGVTDEFLHTLMGRGDFVIASNGYKCLEFNIAGNIGGIHLPFLAFPYFENPVILRFLKESQIKIKNRDVIDAFLEHLVSTAGETLTITGSRLNIAIVAKKRSEAPGQTNEPDEIEIAINQRYEKTLGQLNRKWQGRVIFCDFDDLVVRGEGLYYRDQPVHVLVETYEGAVPPEILHLFKIRRICLFNGPVTGLMSNKLNLALLSEHEDSPLFNEAEREAIKAYIPWTRKIITSETFYQGKKIRLVDFIRRSREQLVMKPAVGYGGEGVAVGQYTSQDQWETVLQSALQKGKWLVQEYVPSLPLLYQYGENGAEPHIGVVGIPVFGNRFGGGSIRMLPCSKRSGVINVHQGARVSILFEVE
jgi:tyrocidine synthetase-3